MFRGRRPTAETWDEGSDPPPTLARLSHVCPAPRLALTIPGFRLPGPTPGRARTQPQGRRRGRARRAVWSRSGHNAPTSPSTWGWVFPARPRSPGWAPCARGSRSCRSPPALAARLQRFQPPSRDLPNGEWEECVALAPTPPALPCTQGTASQVVGKMERFQGQSALPSSTVLPPQESLAIPPLPRGAFAGAGFHTLADILPAPQNPWGDHLLLVFLKALCAGKPTGPCRLDGPHPTPSLPQGPRLFLP